LNPRLLLFVRHGENEALKYIKEMSRVLLFAEFIL